jgi:hypothetical protein
MEKGAVCHGKWACRMKKQEVFKQNPYGHPGSPGAKRTEEKLKTRLVSSPGSQGERASGRRD